MTSPMHRVIAGLAIPFLALALLVATTAPATARSASGASATVPPDPTLPFSYWIDATTTLAKLHKTVAVPRGTFIGSIDLKTFTLTGAIALPPARATVAIAGLPVATATFKISEIGPVTGTVDLLSAHPTATATSVFDIQIVSLTPTKLPFVNLVGNSCKTSKPVSVTLSGPLTTPLAFSGTYTIPPLQNCGLATKALNLVVPGPGNTFSAVATPMT